MEDKKLEQRTGKFVTLLKNYRPLGPSHKHAHNFIYNGVDRVDNTQGYTLSNCVPCCGTCNKMKGALSLKDWLEQLTKIIEHLKS